MKEDSLAKIPGQCLEVIANTAKEAIKAGKLDFLYDSLGAIGLDDFVKKHKQEKTIKKIVDQISDKIDQAKEEIIGNVVGELRDQRLNDLIAKTHSLQKKIGNYYDSPNKNRLDIALESSDDLISALIVQLNDPRIDDDYYLTRIFSLYLVAVCIYCMIQFACISRYAESREEAKAIAIRVANEIEQANAIYNNTSDRLYRNTKNRFTEITERLHEPWTNWFTFPGLRVLYYVFEYKFDDELIEANAVKCETYHPSYYKQIYGSRRDIIVKTTLDGFYLVWNTSLNKGKVLRDAENKRIQHIQQIHNQNYGNFVSYKGNFEMSIEPYQKIFVTKNTKTNL